jgi:threonylcarbamoyladenosine tRNA methylthiotransferase CDKAL1
MTLATDIICGFPTESEEDFEETLALVRKYSFAVCNISQFYPRPGTPAARMKLIKTQIVKDRSRRLSELFNNQIVDPHRGLVGTQQRIWVTEVAHDKHNLCGHTKNYCQVIVDPSEASMGTDVQCKIVDSGRFFVRGKVVKDQVAKEGGMSAKLFLILPMIIVLIAIYLTVK